MPGPTAAAVQPKVDFGEPTTPYAAYAGIDTLHSLLQPRSKEPAENSFIVATQVMELLFGLLRHEWTAAQQAMRVDDLPAATAALRRGLGVQDVLVSSWDLLATMTPVEFSAFRPYLGEASGFQSYTYLHLEFLLGNKSERLLKLYAGSPRIHAELSETLNSPSLYDDAEGVLRRAGAEDWVSVYSDPAHRELALLGELLLDVAERVTRWRQRHLIAVKRAMGAKPGTGGSSGISWLSKAAEQDVFPEIWAARNVL
ncbi:tryptophan 2,3-dioxygenase [Streptacidiphilus sp. PB12-B1b]|uniref:tryptophan 2,3-dioxygenase n=1 Tax=Streptacidiphilus sp. PB12-B1b TaxID=2705012 RepID=UPI0015FB7677|nr:tryptophan 2,3-dioxygenase family protein [Streptacidiphilus sp. PB12-B1b]QMU74909.1 tryptophan 2,3-dioxygenase [Streptacidiphilus sp. PB12-B1b]